MANETADPARRYCGRDFTPDEMERISRLIAAPPPLNRAQLSRRVCEELQWRRPDGGLKDMSCRVAMLRMDRDGLIRLPAPQTTNGNGRIKPRRTAVSDRGAPIQLSLKELGPIQLRQVRSRKDSSLWNELIDRWHYLGYKPLPGAQLRYFVVAEDGRLLAVLGFGAAAWTAAPRDRFIGWDTDERQRNLHLVINNARFLILPWVRINHLASKILGQAARQIANDWQTRYGFRPVCLETFVERDRFRGTCYRAANWRLIGQTTGRGKLEKNHRRITPIKNIFIYPLNKHFRQTLHAKP